MCFPLIQIYSFQSTCHKYCWDACDICLTSQPFKKGSLAPLRITKLTSPNETSDLKDSVQFTLSLESDVSFGNLLYTFLRS